MCLTVPILIVVDQLMVSRYLDIKEVNPSVIEYVKAHAHAQLFNTENRWRCLDSLHEILSAETPQTFDEFKNICRENNVFDIEEDEDFESSYLYNFNKYVKHPKAPRVSSFNEPIMDKTLDILKRYDFLNNVYTKSISDLERDIKLLDLIIDALDKGTARAIFIDKMKDFNVDFSIIGQ